MSLFRLFRLVSGLLLLLALLLLSHFVGAEWRDFARLREGRQALEQVQLSLRAAELVGRERLPSFGVLGDAGPVTPQALQALKAAREQTDLTLASVEQTARAKPDAPGNAMAIDLVPKVRQVLRTVRESVDRASARAASAGRSPVDPDFLRDPGQLNQLRAAVQMLMPVSDGYAGAVMQSYPERFVEVQGAQWLAAIRESAAVLGTLLRPALLHQVRLNAEVLSDIERTQGRIQLLRELGERQGMLVTSPLPLPSQQALERVRRGLFGRNDELIRQVIAAVKGERPMPQEASIFRDRYVADLEPLVELRDLLLEDAMQHAVQRCEEAGWHMLLAGLVLLLVLACLGGAMCLLLYRVVRPLKQAAEAIHGMASGQLETALPAPREPGGHNEVDAVLGALQKLQSSQRRGAQLAEERDELIAKLRKLSSTDPLTGLLNRRAFFEAAERELANARRHGFDVTVLLLDVDHFKAINDTYGHASGDQALIAVAGALQAGLRQGDVLGRHGGEEFVLLLTHCGRLPGLGFAERLRESIAELSVSNQSGAGDGMGGAFGLTASLGVASSREAGLHLNMLLSQADAAMYRAKRGGRNRVASLPPPGAASEESNSE